MVSGAFRTFFYLHSHLRNWISQNQTREFNGIYYIKYHTKKYVKEELRKDVKHLIGDYEVQKKQNVYVFLPGGQKDLMWIYTRFTHPQNRPYEKYQYIVVKNRFYNNIQYKTTVCNSHLSYASVNSRPVPASCKRSDAEAAEGPMRKFAQESKPKAKPDWLQTDAFAVRTTRSQKGGTSEGYHLFNT